LAWKDGLIASSSARGAFLCRQHLCDHEAALQDELGVLGIFCVSVLNEEPELRECSRRLADLGEGMARVVATLQDARVRRSQAARTVLLGDGSESPGASANRAVHRLLQLADLAGEPGIVPGSISAGYGRRLWQRHHDIGLVAGVLRSLDAAARAIDVDVISAACDTGTRRRDGHLDDLSITYQRGKTRSRSSKATTPATTSKPTRRRPQPTSDPAPRVWQAGK